MDKNSINSLKNLLNSLKSDLDELSGKLNQGHKKLKEVTKETEEKYQKQLEQVEAAAKTRKNIDTYLRGLKILIDEEDRKKKIADENILLSKSNINTIIDKIEAVNKITTKSKQGDRNTIINEIKNDLPTLLQTLNEVHTNTNYIISRANANAYTLAKQPILQDAGISYPQPERHLEGLQSHLGHPTLESSISNQISLYRNKVEKLRGRLTDEQSKGFSFIPEKIKAEETKRKQQELRSKFPNIQENELGKSLEASFSFINAQKIPILKGTQTPENLKMRQTIEDMFGVTAPDMIKYTRRANKEKNEVSGKELYEQHKKVRVGDRTDITSIGEEMRDKFLQARNAKFNNPSALKDVSLEQALGTASSIADVIPEAASVVNTPSIEEVKPGREVLEDKLTSPIESSQKISSALVPYTGPGQTSGSDFDYLEEYADKLRNEKLQSSSKSPIGKTRSGGGTRKKRASTGSEVKRPRNTSGGGSSGGGVGSGVGSGSVNLGEFKGIIDVRLVDITTSVIKQLDDLLVKVLSNPSISIKGGGGGTGDMDKLAEELRKNRESNEKLAQMSEARRKAAKAEATKKKKEKEKEKKRIADPNSPESIAKRKKEADAAEREQKRKDREQKRLDRENPDSPENIAKRNKEEEKKRKEKEKNKKAKNPIADLDPFQKRLKKIYEEGREEITLLYAKVNSYLPIFTNAQVEAKKTALNTLKEGYRAFNVIYQRTGSSFKGMMAAINKMFKISPATVILAGMTVAFTGILSAANRLNTRIKEISAELGTSNMQSYELFKNAMNAQTQYDNMYASLRDVRDVQKGILGDSGILLQTNDKALASVADNAKNIGLSVESAGAFYENLRMKGGSDKEASNLMAASLELADKKGFSPQSIVDDIAQNAEFASKYFSNINKHSKSAHRNLIETNLQVKALGLNFQKAAKMTQHLLSFEQSIVAEVEASVALGRHVNIGKARELLLQDDIAGAMTQMMDTMGGYDEFQNMDFAKRQLMANAIGMEVSELEKSLYLREKIGLKDAESLDAAMRNSDYLDKVAGKDAELYKIETKKVMAAERFNTAIEKVSVAFKSSLLPILEAIIPIVDHMAWAINLVAASIKTVGGVLSTGINLFSLGSISSKRKSENQASPAEVASGTVMSAALIFAIGKIGKSKFADKIGEKVGKVRGKFDQLSGALGSESNPMYVKVVGGTLGGGGGASDVASTILDNAGGAAATGTATAGASRFSKVKDFLSRGAGKVKSIASGGLSKAQDLFSKGAGRLKGFSAGAPEKIGKALNSLKNIKPSSIAKIGGVMAVAGAAFDYAQRKKEGQSTKQAATASVGGALGGIAGGAVSGAAMGAFLGPIGAAIGGLIGGTAGYLATTKIIDSHFDKNKSSSFTAQPFMYAGMNGMSGGGGISTSLNKPKATGTPVETSMVDMTPTTFKTMSSGISGINPNYGTTSMARESVMVNTLSKSVEATALMKSVKEKNIEKEKAHKEMMEQQLKILESIREKINQPAVAFFTDEGRRQVINQSRVRNSH